MKKSSRKKPVTPRSKIRQALRLLSLRSRERAERLKIDGYCCQVCGRKQSKAKGKEVSVVVHHKDGAGLEEIIDLIYARLLCSPEHLMTLCETCHGSEHETEA